MTNNQKLYATTFLTLKKFTTLTTFQTKMKFNVLTEMEYTAASPGTLILNIHARRTPHQTVISETFVIDPYIKVEELQFVQSDNRVMRFEIAENSSIKVTYKATI